MSTPSRKALQTQLPKGAKLYLPDEAGQKRHVEETLLTVFRRWGYREIVTPAYEYFDVLSQGTDHELQERMFKMVDRESGRLLALRADVTPQIARIVATRLRDEPKPLRLAYLTNVFRYDEPHVGRYREFYQAGVELVGLPNAEGDAEMIAITVEACRLSASSGSRSTWARRRSSAVSWKTWLPTSRSRASSGRRSATRTSRRSSAWSGSSTRRRR